MISEFVTLEKDEGVDLKHDRYYIISLVTKDRIGEVCWNSDLRCFCVKCNVNCVLTSICMRDLSEWCRRLTARAKQ